MKFCRKNEGSPKLSQVPVYRKFMGRLAPGESILYTVPRYMWHSLLSVS